MGGIQSCMGQDEDPKIREAAEIFPYLLKKVNLADECQKNILGFVDIFQEEVRRHFEKPPDNSFLAAPTDRKDRILFLNVYLKLLVQLSEIHGAIDPDYNEMELLLSYIQEYRSYPIDAKLIEAFGRAFVKSLRKVKALKRAHQYLCETFWPFLLLRLSATAKLLADGSNEMYCSEKRQRLKIAIRVHSKDTSSLNAGLKIRVHNGRKTVRVKGTTTRFSFDDVFDDKSCASNIFESSIGTLVDKFLDRERPENGNVFFFGPLGGGKSYTLKQAIQWLGARLPLQQVESELRKGTHIRSLPSHPSPTSIEEGFVSVEASFRMIFSNPPVVKDLLPKTGIEPQALEVARMSIPNSAPWFTPGVCLHRVQTNVELENLYLQAIGKMSDQPGELCCGLFTIFLTSFSQKHGRLVSKLSLVDMISSDLRDSYHRNFMQALKKLKQTFDDQLRICMPPNLGPAVRGVFAPEKQQLERQSTSSSMFLQPQRTHTLLRHNTTIERRVIETSIAALNSHYFSHEGLLSRGLKDGSTMAMIVCIEKSPSTRAQTYFALHAAKFITKNFGFRRDVRTSVSAAREYDALILGFESEDRPHTNLLSATLMLAPDRVIYSLIDREPHEVNQRWHGDSVLHIAIRNRRFHLAKELVLRGVDANKTNFRGQTPLQMATSYRGEHAIALVRFLQDYTTIRKIAPNEIDFYKKIDHGEFAIVVRGHFLGVPHAVKVSHSQREWLNQQLACKLSESSDNKTVSKISETQNFRSISEEAMIAQHVRGMPNVVPFRGACLDWERKRCFLVFGLLEGHNVQRSVQSLQRQEVFSTSARQFRTLLCHAASGLWSLHDSRIIHCDVAARNFLLNDHGEAFICDFGKSIELPKGKTKARRQGLPYRWMAPESMHPKYEVSESSDVYMFGIFLWECFSGGKRPYEHIASHKEAALKVKAGLRPELDPKWPRKYRDLMEECWNENPEERPRMDDVCKRLNELALPNMRSILKKQSFCTKILVGPDPTNCGQELSAHKNSCFVFAGLQADVIRSDLTYATISSKRECAGFSLSLPCFVLHPPRGKGSVELWSLQKMMDCLDTCIRLANREPFRVVVVLFSPRSLETFYNAMARKLNCTPRRFVARGSNESLNDILVGDWLDTSKKVGDWLDTSKKKTCYESKNEPIADQNIVQSKYSLPSPTVSSPASSPASSPPSSSSCLSKSSSTSNFAISANSDGPCFSFPSSSDRTTSFSVPIELPPLPKDSIISYRSCVCALDPDFKGDKGVQNCLHDPHDRRGHYSLNLSRKLVHLLTHPRSCVVHMCAGPGTFALAALLERRDAVVLDIDVLITKKFIERLKRLSQFDKSFYTPEVEESIVPQDFQEISGRSIEICLNYEDTAQLQCDLCPPCNQPKTSRTSRFLQ